jgi:pseudaminic acid synthase
MKYIIEIENYDLAEKQVNIKYFSRSLYVVKHVKKGELFTEENVRSIRPGFGLHPKYLPEILGKEASVDVEMGDRFKLQMIANK